MRAGLVISLSRLLSEAELHGLFSAAWPDHQPRPFQPVLERSLVWLSAHHDAALVGFVNVATDGGVHAFLLDTTVHPRFQRQGIGSALVRAAIRAAAERGARWLHVDHAPHLDPFYASCGFELTRAGLVDLEPVARDTLEGQLSMTTQAQRADVRVCFIGDSFVAGTGDPAFLGWAGRLCAASPANITLYNLGVRRDTSVDIERRWFAEAAHRVPAEQEGRLVFSFGVNDCALEGGKLRVSTAASVDAARRIMEAAKTFRPLLWLGPTPVHTTQASERNEHIARLSDEYRTLAGLLEIPYFDAYAALHGLDAWRASLQRVDGVHPDATGYALLAELVSHWTGWKELILASRPSGARSRE